MYEDLEDIVINKPIKEATFLDFCQGIVLYLHVHNYVQNL
jgi:hypothetical protein